MGQKFTESPGGVISGSLGLGLGMGVIAMTDEPMLGFACGLALAGLYALAANALSTFVRRRARDKVEDQRATIIKQLRLRPVREDDGVAQVLLDPVKPLIGPDQSGSSWNQETHLSDMVLYLESLVLPLVGEHDGQPVSISWDTREAHTFTEVPAWESDLKQRTSAWLGKDNEQFDLRITLQDQDPRLEKLAGLTSANTLDSRAGFAGSVWEDSFQKNEPVFVGDVPELAAKAYEIGGGFRLTVLKDRYVLDSRLPAQHYSTEEIQAAIAWGRAHQAELLAMLDEALESGTDVPTAIVILAALAEETQASTAALRAVVFQRPECNQTVRALRALLERADTASMASELATLAMRKDLTPQLLKCILEHVHFDEAALLKACRVLGILPGSELEDLLREDVELWRQKDRMLMEALGRTGGREALGYLGARLVELPVFYRSATEQARLAILDRMGDIEGGGLSVAALEGGELSSIEEKTPAIDRLSVLKAQGQEKQSDQTRTEGEYET